MKEVLRVYWFLLFLFLVTSLAHGQVRRDSASRIRFGNTLPATCNKDIGQVFFLIDPGSPVGLYQCLATDTWSTSMGTVTGMGADNQVAVFAGASDIEGTSAFTFDSSTGAITTDHFTVAADGEGFSFPEAVENISIGGNPSSSSALRTQLFITGTGGGIVKGVEFDNFVVGAAGDTFEISTFTVGSAIETAAAVTVIDVMQVQIRDPGTDIGAGGSVTNETTLMIDRIGDAGDNTYGIRVFDNGPTTTAGIVFDGDPATPDSTRDSLAFLQKGFSDSSGGSAQHVADWKYFVDMPNNDGTGSLWTLQHQLDGGGYATKMSVSGASSTLGLPDDTSSIQMGAALDAQIHREAADIISQRRGANSQQWQLYDNFTSPTVYDRMVFYVGGGPPTLDAEIAVESDGTPGRSINLTVEALGNVGFLRLSTSGTNFVDLTGTGGGRFLRFTPDAAINIGSASNAVNNATFARQIHVAETSPYSPSNLDAIRMESNVNLAAPGQEDSAGFLMVGQADDGLSHDADWRWFVDVTNNNGNSVYTLEERIGGANFADILTINNGALTNQAIFRVHADLTADTTGSYRLQGNEVSSAVNPVLLPRNTDVNAGIGGASGTVAIITNSVARLTATDTEITIADNLVVSGVGPHSIAGVTFGAVQLLIGSTFTSDGAGDIASGLFHTPSIVGAAGDTSALTGTTLTAGITTQTATESITNIAQLQVNEPNITDNLTGTITQASTVLITGAPTEATRNYALNVEDGSVRFALAGPHVIGGVPQNFVQYAIGGSFISGGVSNQAVGLRLSTNLGGASGDTLRLAGMALDTIITTQTASNTIADVCQLCVTEPNITDNLTGGGVITNASTLLITGAPTEGANNFALRVTSGLTLVQDLEIDGALNHDGSTVGFFGQPPTTQPVYSVSNVTTDRDYDANSTTLDEIADVLATLIADLGSFGLTTTP